MRAARGAVGRLEGRVRRRQPQLPPRPATATCSSCGPVATWPAGVFPYVHGRLVDGRTGRHLRVPRADRGVHLGQLACSPTGAPSFLVVSRPAAALRAADRRGSCTGWSGARALLWSAAPGARPVRAAQLGPARGRRRHGRAVVLVARPDGVAAVLLGVGACLKVYPGLFLLPLVLERLVRRDVAGAVRGGRRGARDGASRSTCRSCSLDARAGRRRTPSRSAREPTRAATASGTGSGAAPDDRAAEPAGAGAGARAPRSRRRRTASCRARRGGEFPVVQVCAAALVAFLLVNKVASPQYTLWLLPFFALLRVRLGWWAAFQVADALVYVGVFRWFAALVGRHGPGPAEAVLRTGVWSKSALLVVLFPLAAASAAPCAPQPTQRPDVNVSTSSAISGRAARRRRPRAPTAGAPAAREQHEQRPPQQRRPADGQVVGRRRERADRQPDVGAPPPSAGGRAAGAPARHRPPRRRSRHRRTTRTRAGWHGSRAAASGRAQRLPGRRRAAAPALLLRGATTAEVAGERLQVGEVAGDGEERCEQRERVGAQPASVHDEVLHHQAAGEEHPADAHGAGGGDAAARRRASAPAGRAASPTARRRGTAPRCSPANRNTAYGDRTRQRDRSQAARRRARARRPSATRRDRAGQERHEQPGGRPVGTTRWTARSTSGAPGKNASTPRSG